MKKRVFFLLALQCLLVNVALPVVAQQPGSVTGLVAGTVTDSSSGQPVAFATVALFEKNASAAAAGTLTNAQGTFTFAKVPAGEYAVQVSFVGYAAKKVGPVAVTAQQPTVQVPAILLAPVANKLQEVTVVGQKPLVEDKIDRLVYNADQDLTNVGGNAADVLKKVPSLSLDAEGNVQLRGSGNVRVLVNNKASSIMATNLADALKQIPAETIKSVEVITSPSAKYDAEGSAGIINIITKKNSMQGLKGSAGFTAGTQSSSVYSNLALRRQKTGLHLNLNGFAYSVPKGYGMYRQEYLEGEDVVTVQDGDGRVHGGGGSMQAGLDYDLDSLNLFSVGLKLNTGKYQGRSAQVTTTNQPGARPFIRNTNQYAFTPLGLDVNLDYTRIFRPQQELAVLAQFSQSDHGNWVNQDWFTRQEDRFYLQRNTNQNRNRELTFQTDYTQALPQQATLEVGAKTILRHAESDARYAINFPPENQDAPQENRFNYRQQVVAGYASYGLTFQKKFAFKAGLRYEHTWLQGDFLSTQTYLRQDYATFIPSFSFSRTLKENHTLKASYTQRIQRPHIFLLNPYRDSRDPKSVFFGNPALDPERTHVYEVGYSTFFKTSSVSSALYVRQVENAIQQVTLRIEDGVAQYSFANAGKLLSYGVNFSGSTKPVPALSLNGNGNVYYNRLQGLGTQNSGWQYNLNLNTGYEFGQGVSAQFSGGFNSARVTLQGHALSWSYHSLSVKKELWEKKGSLTLGANNPFVRSINYGQETYTDTFTQTNENRNFSGSVRLTFDYKFGQQTPGKPARKKKTIKNDDVKQEG